MNVYTTKAGKWYSIDKTFLDILTVGDMRTSFPDMCDYNIWDVMGAKTLTNKTLTSPKINENVALTTTATELNLLHNNLVGAAYTPSTSGLTLGNGTLVARKIQLGKLVFATIQFTLGSTSAIGTDARITLPVTEQSYPPSLGIARYNDVSAVRQYTGWWREGYLGVPGVDYGNITATFPFTWATGDTIYASIVYEAV